MRGGGTVFGRRNSGSRVLATWLLVQVLLGTLLPAVQAQPLWNSIFEVLDARYCADPGDERAPARHHDAGHCILCFGAAKTGLAAVALPALPTPAVQLAPAAGLPPAATPPRALLHEAIGCRDPPRAA